MPDGREVKGFTLTNKNGLKARVTEYGAILVAMETDYFPPQACRPCLAAS